jgi:hypothetical protein
MLVNVFVLKRENKREKRLCLITFFFLIPFVFSVRNKNIRQTTKHLKLVSHLCRIRKLFQTDKIENTF